MIRETRLLSSVASYRGHRSRLGSNRGVQRVAVAQEGRHALPDGTTLEVLSDLPEPPSTKPPLLFIHGSVHGAWCWKEHFLPFFAQQGYPAYALSLRGHGKSEGRELKVSGTLQSHSDDIIDFAKTLEMKPVLLGHSFAALVVYFLSLDTREQYFSGFAALAPSPPTGNRAMIQRFFRLGFLKSLRLTWVLVARAFKQNPKRTRALFFSDDLPEEDLLRYQERFVEISRTMMMNPADVSKYLPLQKPVDLTKPAFVLGSTNDALVDAEGVRESAEWYGVEPVIIDGSGHDVMLDTQWRSAAESLLDWLNTEL